MTRLGQLDDAAQTGDPAGDRGEDWAGDSDAALGYSDRYDPDEHFDRWYTDATADQLVTHLRPGDQVLELGSATGRMTAPMCAAGAVVLGIEKSIEYTARARAAGADGATFELDDFETWVSRARHDRPASFDHIVATNVVHEVHDLSELLVGCRDLLRAGGLLHISLQNPKSIHRLVGESLGLVSDLCEVTDEGRQLLTLRLYDADELAALICGAGLEMVQRHGVMLKPFPNAEMARLSDRQIEGLIAGGPSLPDNCAINYLTARSPNHG